MRSVYLIQLHYIVIWYRGVGGSVCTYDGGRVDISWVAVI